MPSGCGCGTEMSNSFHSLGCLECGAGLCPSCAISLESVTYCASCAAELLGTRHVRAGSPFELQ
jgi:hypothetical protein